MKFAKESGKKEILIYAVIASGKSSLQKAIMCLENAVDLAKQQKLPWFYMN